MGAIYWKVHKDNLKYIENITEYQLMAWTEIIEADRKKYIYIVKNKKPIFSFSENSLGYMHYDKKETDEYFKKQKHKYKGEFFSKKESRLKKLKKLENETI
jgi:hypothetical protein